MNCFDSKNSNDWSPPAHQSGTFPQKITTWKPDRLASSKIACQNANEIFKDEVKGSVAASDAFFPFADGLNELIKIGVKCIIQPGGSIKDDEVIKFYLKFYIKILKLENYK